MSHRAVARQLNDPQHVYIWRVRGGYLHHCDTYEYDGKVTWRCGDPIRFTRAAAVNLIARIPALHDAALVEVGSELHDVLES